MDKLFVGLVEITMMMAVFLFVPLALLARILISVKNKKALKEALLVILMPFSIGYYIVLEDSEKTKWYNYLIIAFSVCAFIGVLFTIYQWIPPFAQR